MELAVTIVPARMADALGIDAAAVALLPRAVLWHGTIENVGPGTVYLRRAIAQPDPLTAVGSKLSRGGRRTVTEYSANFLDGPYWIWTAHGAATLLLEETSAD